MTNNKQQTPVQQLASKLSITDRARYNGVIEEALEEEKNHIIDAYENGVSAENERNLSGECTNSKQYYNETYGDDKQ